jgi:hypothetical protein
MTMSVRMLDHCFSFILIIRKSFSVTIVNCATASSSDSPQWESDSKRECQSRGVKEEDDGGGEAEGMSG